MNEEASIAEKAKESARLRFPEPFETKQDVKAAMFNELESLIEEGFRRGFRLIHSTNKGAYGGDGKWRKKYKVSDTQIVGICESCQTVLAKASSYAAEDVPLVPPSDYDVSQDFVVGKPKKNREWKVTHLFPHAVDCMTRAETPFLGDAAEPNLESFLPNDLSEFPREQLQGLANRLRDEVARRPPTPPCTSFEI